MEIQLHEDAKFDETSMEFPLHQISHRTEPLLITIEHFEKILLGISTEDSLKTLQWFEEVERAA